MASEDRESYNLEEMMERLRGGDQPSSEEEPKLITRDDGTQVYKVRKRKRRTKQEHKEREKKRRKKVLWIVSSFVICLLVFLSLLFAWILKINSKSYGEKIIAEIENTTGAKAAITGFRTTPLSIGADLVSLQWPEATLTAHNMSGDLRLSSHLNGQWIGESLNVGAINAFFASPQGMGKNDNAIPNINFLFPIRTGRLRLKLGGTEQQPKFGIYDGKAIFFPNSQDSADSRLILEGGKFRLGNWGQFSLEIASLSFQRGGMYLGNIIIGDGETLDSEIQIGGNREQQIPLNGGMYEANISFTNVSSEMLLGPDLGKIIASRFQSVDSKESGKILMNPIDFNSLNVRTIINCPERQLVDLQNLPILGRIAELFNESRLEHPKMMLRSPFRLNKSLDGNLKIAGLDLEMPHFLRIQGAISEEPGKKLGGELELGIHRSLVELIGNERLRRVFSEQRGPYYWIRIQLSGTPAQPRDNFQEIWDGSETGSVPEQPSATEHQAPASSNDNVDWEKRFLELTTPPQDD